MFEIFLEEVKKECNDHNVELILENSEFVIVNNLTCSGYFYAGTEDYKGELVVATKEVCWEEVLVHEYCHLKQWAENYISWELVEKSGNKLEDWLSGKKVKNIHKYINIIRNVELDADKRAVEIIKKYKLDIDIASYIKYSNYCAYFYNYMKKSRKWMDPNEPIEKQTLIESIMPTHFENDYTKIPLEIEKIFTN
jgi:hypothetical protein